MAFGVIKNVRKVFQLDEIGWTAREPVVALDDASFQFEEGELVALLGPSGCGKTTLLRIVGGLIPISAGSVVIAGREVTKPMGDYGFVFQPEPDAVAQCAR
jgi:NitT/TauT family transport system ATP-binding protein